MWASGEATRDVFALGLEGFLRHGSDTGGAQFALGSGDVLTALGLSPFPGRRRRGGGGCRRRIVRVGEGGSEFVQAAGRGNNSSAYFRVFESNAMQAPATPTPQRRDVESLAINRGSVRVAAVRLSGVSFVRSIIIAILSSCVDVESFADVVCGYWYVTKLRAKWPKLAT